MKAWLSILLVIATVGVLVNQGANVPLIHSKNRILQVEQPVNQTAEVIVRVALYDCGWNNRHFYDIFNYSWVSNNHSYSFQMTVVDADDVRGQGQILLDRDTFDLLLIGASAS